MPPVRDGSRTEGGLRRSLDLASASLDDDSDPSEESGRVLDSSLPLPLPCRLSPASFLPLTPLLPASYLHPFPCRRRSSSQVRVGSEGGQGSAPVDCRCSALLLLLTLNPIPFKLLLPLPLREAAALPLPGPRCASPDATQTRHVGALACCRLLLPPGFWTGTTWRSSAGGARPSRPGSARTSKLFRPLSPPPRTRRAPRCVDPLLHFWKVGSRRRCPPSRLLHPEPCGPPGSYTRTPKPVPAPKP